MQTCFITKWGDRCRIVDFVDIESVTVAKVITDEDVELNVPINFLQIDEQSLVH